MPSVTVFSTPQATVVTWMGTCDDMATHNAIVIVHEKRLHVKVLVDKMVSIEE